MTKNHIRKIEIVLIGLSIMIFLVNSAQAVDILTAANKEGLVSTPSGPDCSYCTSTGYMCASKAGVNNGKPICHFPNGKWCDAHAYFIGNCSISSTPLNPYNFYNNPQGALDIADATRTCNKYGGQAEPVHTPFGDLVVCIFPNGESIDLPGLDYLTSQPGSSREQAIWSIEAYSLLNEP